MQLRISEGYRCVLVMCDFAWLDPDGNAGNGVEHALQRDFLRIDSMVSRLPCVLGRAPCLLPAGRISSINSP